MSNLKNKTIFITGASRGIGREIALRFARDGANIVVIGKTADPHPKLKGTILPLRRRWAPPAAGRCRCNSISATRIRSPRP
jgi:NAD(P)-dependent dehydrogenase (short-subunit alcohol dehydrogenase family)